MGASVTSLQCCQGEQVKQGIPQLPRGWSSGAAGRQWEDESPESIRMGEPRSGQWRLARLFNLDVEELSAIRLSDEAHEMSVGPEFRRTYRFRSGASYTGQWLGRARHGFGVQKWADGTRYEGQWANNRAEGRGRITFANGDRYTGEWRANSFHGLGAYRASDGMMYFGSWSEDQREGYGVEVASGGVKYAGDFQAGCKEGVGLCVWPDGGQYCGDWRDDEISGCGTHRNAKGGVFRGSWRAAARHGIGCHVWSDGRCYMGNYKDGCEVGFGCYLDQTGLQYTVGQWSNGAFHRQAPHTTDLELLPALQTLALLQPEPTTPRSDEIVMVRTPSWDSVRLCRTPSWDSIQMARSNSGSQATPSPISDIKPDVFRGLDVEDTFLKSSLRKVGASGERPK